MQHHSQTLTRPPSQKPIAIEVDGEPLGVVVPSTEGFRFLAVRLQAFGIDGHTFETVEAARSALGDIVHAHQL